jgi:IS5 family transposase
MMSKQADAGQYKLFSTLAEQLNPRHPLYVLANRMPWEEFELSFMGYYSDTGRPAKRVRLMVSLILLKQMYSHSDETIVEQWVQNPYYQYFSGETMFQWEIPCDPSDLVHFRKRIGEAGVKTILQSSIKIHGTKAQEPTVIADTTVQEKNITFPVDIKQHCKIIHKCRDIAQKEHIVLRQSYTRVVKDALLTQRFTRSRKASKKAMSARRKIFTIAGRLCRELMRKLSSAGLNRYKNTIALFERVLKQKKADINKIYSLHEPNVYCISKGKAHKKYEYGSKVSLLVTKETGIIVGALSFDTNVYDGHTLPQALEQYKELLGRTPKELIADRGYRGETVIGETIISIPKKTTKTLTAGETQRLKQKFRRRASIEPIIGHLKSDTLLGRNYLKGVQGDRINAMLAAAAFNFRKWLREFFVQTQKRFQNLVCTFSVGFLLENYRVINLCF